MKRLGRHWKTLQRIVYAAAVLTLLNWAALHDWKGWTPAPANFGPLVVLEGYRIWWLLTPAPAAAQRTLRKRTWLSQPVGLSLAPMHKRGQR